MVENTIHRTSNLHLNWVAASNVKEQRGCHGFRRTEMLLAIMLLLQLLWGTSAFSLSPFGLQLWHQDLPCQRLHRRHLQLVSLDQQLLQPGHVAASTLASTLNQLLLIWLSWAALSREQQPKHPFHRSREKEGHRQAVAQEREINCRKLGFHPRFYMVENGSWAMWTPLGPKVSF